MCVCVLCFKKTATAQKTNRQKKHETVCAFCLFVVFFHVPAVLHDWDNQGTVHQRCTTCLLPPGQIFISISVSHTCMIFRKMSDSRTCRVLHQLKSPLLIRSEVMSWNSSNHFIKTSPRLLFFCGTYVVGLVAWSLGEVVEAQCWLSSQFIRHNQAISHCLPSFRPADNGGRSCCHRG